jgi:hypothetical protein
MSRLAEIRQGLRLRRLDRAARHHSLRMNGAQVPFVPGSEHTNLLRHPRGF